MLIGKPPDIPSSAITSKDEYERQKSRRRFLRNAAAGMAAVGAAALGAERVAEIFEPRIRALAGTKLDTVKSPLTTTGETLTSFEDITHYNNFYEFGVDKGDPSKNAGGLPTRPWTVKVDRQGQDAEDIRHRSPAQVAATRRPRIPPSLR